MTRYRIETVDIEDRVAIEVYYPVDATTPFRKTAPRFSSHEEARAAAESQGAKQLPNFEDLPADPNNPGWVLGYGVVMDNPWHFGGVYASEDEAYENAARLGTEYVVRHGSHRLDSDDFVFTQ
jgi:hypothetical protein